MINDPEEEIARISELPANQRAEELSRLIEELEQELDNAEAARDASLPED